MRPLMRESHQLEILAACCMSLRGALSLRMVHHICERVRPRTGRGDPPYAFCMCNPPFFESIEEAGQNPNTARTVGFYRQHCLLSPGTQTHASLSVYARLAVCCAPLRRAEARSKRWCIPAERCAALCLDAHLLRSFSSCLHAHKHKSATPRLTCARPLAQLAFVKRIVADSWRLQKRVWWYTTMVGKKSTLKASEASRRTSCRRSVHPGLAGSAAILPPLPADDHGRAQAPRRAARAAADGALAGEDDPLVHRVELHPGGALLRAAPSAP